MMEQTENNETENWRTRSYFYGISVGTIIGFLSAYLYNRAAEEDADSSAAGKPPQIKTTQLIGLGLTALGLIRQISEMGKPDKKK